MRARLTGLALAALLVFGSPALAQAPTPSPQPSTAQTHSSPDADFIAWAQHMQSLLQRVSGGMQAMGRAGDAFGDPDPNARLAALHQLSAAAAQARLEIAAVKPELDAVQPFTEPGANPIYYPIADSLLRNTHEMFSKLDGLLADMITLVQAVDAHDVATVRRLSPQVIQGVVVLVQGQAITLRARQATIPQTNPAYFTLSAMAAMYDGMAGLIGDGRNFDPAVLDRAADTIDQAIAQYRVSLAAAQTAPHPGVSDTQWQAFITICNRVTVIDQGVTQVLRTAAQEGRAGTSTFDIRMNHISELSVFEEQYQQNSRDLINIASQATH